MTRRMVIKYNELEIITSDGCRKMPAKERRFGATPFVQLEDCEVCHYKKEIDYVQRLVGCGEPISKTLVDFEVSSSEEVSVFQ